jgi:hypothetical protein
MATGIGTSVYRFKMSGVIFSAPLYAFFYGVNRDTFTFTLLP